MDNQRKNAILLHERDNVVTAIRNLKAYELGTFFNKTDIRSIQVMQDIPKFHKFALDRINAGNKVIKYGQSIGIATNDIESGEHVHVHNLNSMREDFLDDKEEEQL